MRPSLKQPYDGPYKVLERQEKYFVVERKGQPQRIAIDRLKPAFVAEDAELRVPPTADDWIIPLTVAVTPVRGSTPSTTRVEQPARHEPAVAVPERRVHFEMPAASRIPRRTARVPVTTQRSNSAPQPVVTRLGRTISKPQRYR